MTQNNLYMEDDNMRLYVDVQPLFIDELESSKNAAAASALQAAQSEANARTWKNDIIDYKTGLELFYAQASDGITNSYNTSISGLSAAKSSAINDLNSQKSSIQSSLNNSLNSAMNNIATNGQNYVNQARSYAEEAQRTVDNRVSKDHLNQSKGLETGSVSTDEEVLADVKKYAHSTYCGDQTEGSTPGYLQDGITPLDPKKFTVVGSPTITSDGIASGFSGYPNTSKTLRTPTMDLSKPCKVTCKFKTGNTILGSIFGGGSCGLTLKMRSANEVVCYLKLSDNTILITESYTSSLQNFQNNTAYIGTYEWTGTQHIYRIYKEDGTKIFERIADSTVAPKSGTIFIGSVYTDQAYNAFIGSIDLKQFSITVDGVPVFSGNKTGIDTIKSDNYSTSVTPPTITADGIATDLIGKSITLPVGSISGDFDFEFQYTTADAIQTTWVLYNTGIFAILQASWGWTLSVYANNSAIASANFGSSQTVRRANPVANTKYKFKFSRSGDTYTLGIQAEDEESMTTTTASNSTALDRTSIIIEQNSDNTYSFTVDLNKIHLFVNGDLDYQPCLKIPYTESKTGSKIVNAIYRDRISDMYLQYGYANYYTLSDTDFTLPMGEVYGMIEKLRELIIQRTS